ncbi:MAG: hypothetical protein KKD01_01270 [Proteobacteria bacterium]|nr:hypothetical protein [Pseudomonadota bacterium]MBU1418266.1 hypothetical protein [Pseudomonadota bacterium]MBU1453330.1 hypothetical protein [Pseudomonadota bacterium]
MSKKNNNSDNRKEKEGFSHGQGCYKPSGREVTGGHKPEKSEAKPVNPPKKK